MLQRVDDLILTDVERFCHWFQRLTGVTSLRLATAVAIVSSACFVVASVWMDSFLVRLMGFLSIIYPLLICVVHEAVDQYYREGASVAHSYTLQERMKYRGRCCYILVLVFSWVSILSGGQFVAQTFHTLPLMVWIVWVGYGMTLVESYLECVIPLPPGMSKINQWREEIRAGFRKQVRVPAR